MANLKWTTDIKLNDVSVVSVQHSIEVERDRSEVVLQAGNKMRSVAWMGRGKY